MQSNQGSPTDNPPRHWRGMPGNRLEHTNVWVIGGRPQPYRPEIPRPDTTTTSSVNSATITNDPITSSMNMRRVCLPSLHPSLPPLNNPPDQPN